MSGSDAFDDDAFDDMAGEGEFDELIGLLREGPIEMTDESPSSAIWAGISAELGLAAGGDQAVSSIPGVETHATTAPIGDAGSTSTDGGSNVVSLAHKRPTWGRPAAILTLAAAVILLLAVPVGLSLRSGDDTELIAAADLQLLEGQTGKAVIADLVSVNGDLVIDVDVPTEVPDGEFLELWLLEVGADGVEDLESLGRVDGSGRYDVPDDIDLSRFTVVDISVELDDGDDSHSGNSVVRGELA